MNEFFGRLDNNKNVVVFTNDGELATRLPDCINGIYPIGSNVSTQYDHPEGIVIALSDAYDIGLEIEN